MAIVNASGVLVGKGTFFGALVGYVGVLFVGHWDAWLDLSPYYVLFHLGLAFVMALVTSHRMWVFALVQECDKLLNRPKPVRNDNWFWAGSTVNAIGLGGSLATGSASLVLAIPGMAIHLWTSHKDAKRYRARLAANAQTRDAVESLLLTNLLRPWYLFR